MFPVFRFFIGYFGEVLVLCYFKTKCYKIVKHRYACKFGEIDLIVSRGNKLVFIEVKTSLLGIDIPISYYQRKSIVNVSKYFLGKYISFKNHLVSYDLCFLSIKKGFIHMKNAWCESGN
ncbi:YraN family protein [Wolbachia endosymbiont of Pentidionis agamae]|uniref:YraN family protein n=1 Tax=Wolbachia endosymbiont of Pentidionis agamae TaxID=3110435 RepID=UPI002FD53CEF